MKYTDNFRNQYAGNYDNIYDSYTILSVEMNKNIRVFSMQDINNRLYFIKVKNKLKEIAEYSDGFKRQILQLPLYRMIDYLPEDQLCVRRPKTFSEKDKEYILGSLFKMDEYELYNDFELNNIG